MDGGSHLLLVSSFVVAAMVHVDRRLTGPDKPTTVVQGCLQGRTLKATNVDTSGVQTHTFRLRIPKGLAAALKEHEGHKEELTGVLSDSERTMGGGRTKAVDSRTKVTIGAREERNTGRKEDPQLEVVSFRHLATSCGHGE
jgi:hypothetical protein